MSPYKIIIVRFILLAVIVLATDANHDLNQQIFYIMTLISAFN